MELLSTMIKIIGFIILFYGLMRFVKMCDNVLVEQHSDLDERSN